MSRGIRCANPVCPREGAESGCAGRAESQVDDIVERQVADMARPLDDLLDMSRITLGNVVLKKEPIAALLGHRDSPSKLPSLSSTRSGMS